MLTDFKWEYEKGEEKLKDKGLLDEINSIFKKLKEPTDTKAREELKKKGWDTKYNFPKNFRINELEDFDFEYDAYKKEEKVALEFEAGAQWKARWHWMKFQIGKNFDAVDVGIIIIKYNPKGIQGRKVKRDLESPVFKKILNLNVPMYFLEVK